MTLDPAALDHLLEITGGDPAFVDELIDTFIDDAADQLANLRAGAGTGDQERLLRGAHSLKSSSVNVGATKLAELCRALEMDARAGPVADAGSRVDAIEQELAGVRTGLVAGRSNA